MRMRKALDTLPRRSRQALAVGLPTLLGLLLAVTALAAAERGHASSDQLPDAPRTWTRVALRQAGYDPGTLLDPRGVGRAPGDRFYVADRGHQRVAVVDGTGAVVAAFGVPGTGPTGLEEPLDVAVDASRDRVYVADYGNRRVAVFTLQGIPVAHWRQAGPDEAFAPYAVAAAPDSGDLFVVSRVTGGRVERFSADGTWLQGWGGPGSDPGRFNAPEGLAVDAAGRVLVADANNARVQVFTADGRHQATWPGLAGARDVAVDPTSGQVHVLVGNDRVHVLMPNGSPLRVLRAQDAEVDFRPAAGLALGGDGRLALTTGPGSPDGRHGLRQFAADGALLAATVADPLNHPGFVRPAALAMAPDGALLVVDPPTRAVGRYAPDGALISRFDEGGATEITVAADGTVHVADWWGRIRTRAADGRHLAERSCDCFVGLGLAASPGQLYVTEALTGAIGVLSPGAGGPQPHQRLTVPDPPYAWPLDLALGPDGRLYAAGGDNGRVDVLDPATGAVESFGAGGGGAERISVAADGTVFVLRYDGSVAAYAADGRLEASWLLATEPGARPPAPRDLAAGPGGRLYVLDGLYGHIHVFDAAPAAAASPTPAATPASPCTVVGDKTAAPSRVELGAEVTVRLALDIRCPAGSEPKADVMLVVDRSNSMAGLKLADARRAAEVFVDGLDLTRHRVGLVTFSDVALLDQPLTADGTAIRRAIRAVQAHGTTDIAASLELAVRQIVHDGRPDALGVVLLMTDGEPTGSRQAYVDAVRRAARARGLGILVFAIGLGVNVDEALLVTVAGSDDRYFFAPEAAQLEDIYRQLSEAVGDTVASDLQVTDELGPDVDLVPGSASGRPVVTGRVVTWAVGPVPESGVPDLTLRVVPRRLGLLPTNRQAVAVYTVAGNRYAFTFPVPMIEVVERMPATATSSPPPTATAAPTATPRPPSRPSTAYLPLVKRPLGCPPDRRKPADIVLVVDTSTSMQGEKMAAAVAAARAFLGLVSPERDRVGLVGFNAATRVMPLTTDFGAVARALDGLPMAEGTRIDLGLYEVLSEFYYRARPEAARVAVLLSDGQPTPGTRDSALEQAELMRVYGVTLYAVGLGSDVDEPLMRALAHRPDAYYFAPTAADLASIYERIAVLLPCE